MPVRRAAILSVHSSPLAPPGTGDSGGMNVYVRALARALVDAGVACDVLTRADHPDVEAVVEIAPGLRVLHVDAGPRGPVRRTDLPDLVEPFTDAVLDLADAGVVIPDVLHANYWLSGAVGHRLKHALGRPLAATFHTLARVKADAGIDDDPATRARIEHEVVACADLMLASTAGERDQLASLYGADPARVEIVPPGVDHARFHPRGRAAARRRLGLDGRRVLLFAGRIQPLKGADLALACVAELGDPEAVLLLVGGPSGPDGTRELARLHRLCDDLGLHDRVRFVPAVAHERLADYYRAADVCLVPSRTESFGLVALEAAACATPVVAASVGGLRSLIDDGVTGVLVESRAPEVWAARVRELLDDPARHAAVGTAAYTASARYSWSTTAARLRRLYADLVTSELVTCA